MKQITMRPLALAAALIFSIAVRPASAQFGTNLIANPGAETGPGSTDGSVVEVFPDWTLNGTMTVLQYANNGGYATASSPGPIIRGANYFAGGPNSASATAAQSIDVAAGAALIDQGHVPYRFSAFLGGEGGLNDVASVTADFLDVNSNDLSSVTIGPVTAADRNDITELLFRSAGGTVPAGTRNIMVTMSFVRGSGTYDYGYADNLSLVLGAGNTFDVNGDGNGDLLYQNPSTGQLAVQFMSNGQQTSWGTITTIPEAGYNAVGTGDFNGDGHPDIVFQNQTTGRIVIWYMNGLNVIGGTALSRIPEADYRVAAIGDFNGDGQMDIAFQNTISNKVVFWYFNGTEYIGGSNLSDVPDSGYQIIGSGDFNSDGNTDLVFQNQSSGVIAFWFMNGTSVTGGAKASQTPLHGYVASGVADIGGDGNPVIMFQNANTNGVAAWYMSGNQVEGGGLLKTQPAAGFELVGPR